MNSTARLLGFALTAVLGCGGSAFEAASGAPLGDAAADSLGHGDGAGQSDAGPLADGSAEASVDAGVGIEASVDAALPAEFILCTTGTYTGSLEAVEVPFGCGLGWWAASDTIGSPAQQAARAAAGPYTVTMLQANGPPVRCVSTDPPPPVVGLCPWSVSTSNQAAWVECVVTAADGGVLGYSPSCSSVQGP